MCSIVCLFHFTCSPIALNRKTETKPFHRAVLGIPSDKQRSQSLLDFGIARVRIKSGQNAEIIHYILVIMTSVRVTIRVFCVYLIPKLTHTQSLAHTRTRSSQCRLLTKNFKRKMIFMCNTQIRARLDYCEYVLLSGEFIYLSIQVVLAL